MKRWMPLTQNWKMDTNPTELQFLSTVGILVEAFRIPTRKAPKIVSAITLSFILPLCLVLLCHSLVSDPLIQKIQRKEQDFITRSGTPDADETVRRIAREGRELLLFRAGYALFVRILSLLSTAAIVYTVGCIYTGKDVSYAKIVRAVPKVWKRLMVTFLYAFLFVIAYNIIMATILGFGVLVIGKKSIRFMQAFPFVFLAFYVAFCIYMFVVWSLCGVVSVMEDNYGTGALQKSIELTKGKRTQAFLLVLLPVALASVIELVFYVVVTCGHGGITLRIIYGAFLVLFLSFVKLISMLALTVFYFVCKSYHYQRIDKSVLWDRLELYDARYMLLKGSVQLEKNIP